MSSPFDAELLERLRDLTSRQPVTLLEVYFADAPGGAATLRAANAGGVVLPDGTVYEAGATFDRIRATIDRLGGGPSPCETTVQIDNRLWAVLGGLDVFQSLPTWRWQGATATIYLWERSVSAASKKGRVFQGTIDSIRVERGTQKLTLNCIQPRDWNKPTPKDTIDKITSPNAPEGTLGQSKPIIYGDWNDNPMRAPFTTAYGSKQKQQDAGAGRGVVPLVLVDPGQGADKVKILAAGHECADLLDRANGFTVYMQAGDILAPLDTAGLTETMNADESFIEIDDDAMIAYYAVRPVDVRDSVNTALNPRRAMDPFDETSFATLDQNTGNGVLCLQLPSGNNQGRIETVDILMAFIGDAGNTHQIRAYPYNPVTAGSPAATNVSATGTTPSIYEHTYDPTWYGSNWEFGGFPSSSPDRTVVDIRVDFTGGTTNKAKIIWIVLRVKYRPNRSIVTPAKRSPATWAFAPQNRFGRTYSHPQIETQVAVDLPATYDIEATFFANLKGHKDDGSGTYTGVASALVQAVPDVIRHFLATYAAQTSFETAYDATDPTVGFGSFVKARYLLYRGTPAPPQIACWIGGSQVGAIEIVGKMAQMGLGCVLLDRFTGKWMFHPWTQDAAVDYDLVLEKDDLPAIFEADVTSDVELLQGFRVQYGYDHLKGRTDFETFCTPQSSTMGYSLPSWRDQKTIEITNSNKYIDFKRNTTNVAATIALGTYERPETLATAAETAINTALTPGGGRVWCGHSWTIVEGVNDDLPLGYKDNPGGTYDGVASLTIPPGIYGSPNVLAATVQVVLNAAGIVASEFGTGDPIPLTFVVRYRWTTGKFEIVCNEDNVQVPLDIAGAAESIASGWAALGWDASYVSAARAGDFGADPTTAAVLVAPDPRYRERYYVAWKTVAYHDAGQIRWGTGSNAANNCAFEMGFDKSDITFGASSWGVYSIYPREMRETIAAASEARYGPKLPGTFIADWVRDENSALMLRNGLFDFTNYPRVTIRAATHVCPDLQRFRILGFGASVDQIVPFPKLGSDGSWAGKRMRVLEVEQEIQKTYEVIFAAEEA